MEYFLDQTFADLEFKVFSLFYYIGELYSNFSVKFHIQTCMKTAVFIEQYDTNACFKTLYCDIVDIKA